MAKPINFKYSNKILQPSNRKYSKNISGVDPLPIWTDGEQCVSCWKLSFTERLKAFIFGNIWLSLLSGETQFPAYIEASKSYLKEA